MKGTAGFLVMTGLTLTVSACAQVPKESVELSATVGRDLAVVHNAHRELAETLFQRMRDDVNRFVDQVYAPYQIRAAMDRQRETAESSDPAVRRKSLLLAIKAAFSPGASEELQANVLKGMEKLVSRIRDDIELMRAELLQPLLEQEAEVLASIDRSYQKLHYANSIVTGHLSSVAKVHETQAELLDAIGVDRDLRAQVGKGLSRASDQIGRLVSQAERAEDSVDKAEDDAEALKEIIQKLGAKLDERKKEDGDVE